MVRIKKNRKKKTHFKSVVLTGDVDPYSALLQFKKKIKERERREKKERMLLKA